MKKLLAAVLILFASAVAAQAANGYVYLGKYLPGTEWASSPDNQRGADWRVGVYLEEPFAWFTPYGEVETTIDQSFGSKYFFHPSMVLYKIGAYRKLPYNVTLKIEHGCAHHIDSTPGESHTNQQYNRVELIYHFGGD